LGLVDGGDAKLSERIDELRVRSLNIANDNCHLILQVGSVGLVTFGRANPSPLGFN
jgi:hypothetical protein